METLEEMADNETIQSLDNIWEFYRDWTPWQLSELTHEEGSPWYKTWRQKGMQIYFGVVIPDETIRNYYAERSQEDKDDS